MNNSEGPNAKTVGWAELTNEKLTAEKSHLDHLKKTYCRKENLHIAFLYLKSTSITEIH